MHFKALPDETFEGRVTFVLHEPRCRDPHRQGAPSRSTIRATALSTRCYADAEIDAGSGEGERLAVPASSNT